MERLKFEDYEDFACEIADKFDSLEGDFDDISIIAKYDEAKEIIRELLCLGYDVASLDIHDELWENFYDEYIVSVSYKDEIPFVWCEKFKRETGYINDNPTVAYVMDNCSSAVFKHINSEEVYEVCVGEDEADEEDDDYSDEDDGEEYETKSSYTINGKSVDKETFDEYVSQFVPDLVDEDNKNDDSEYSITVKVNLDTDEAEKIVRSMRERFKQEVSNMVDILYRPYLYEYHILGDF